jgi:hypothetical protein
LNNILFPAAKKKRNKKLDDDGSNGIGIDYGYVVELFEQPLRA